MWSWDGWGPAWECCYYTSEHWMSYSVTDSMQASKCLSLWCKTSKAVQYHEDAIYKLGKLGDTCQQSDWANVQTIHVLSCTYLMKRYNSETNKPLQHLISH